MTRSELRVLVAAALLDPAMLRLSEPLAGSAEGAARRRAAHMLKALSHADELLAVAEELTTHDHPHPR